MSWKKVVLLANIACAFFYRRRYGLSSRLFTNKLLVPSFSSSTEEHVRNGQWIKLICGASNQDVPLIRNLCLVYTKAGVDCIDISSDAAVIAAVHEGVNAAMCSVGNSNIVLKRPLIMISINDNEDLHFRKAYFNPAKCPPTCPRPCEKVCPAWAIPSLDASSASTDSGVLVDKCYGCGRCISLCPLGLIEARSYTSDKAEIAELIKSSSIDAVEIHTHEGNEFEFAELWQTIGAAVLQKLKVISISFPSMGENTLPYLETLQAIMMSNENWNRFKGFQIWQTDGRPMSGDIGKGTAHAAARFASVLLQNSTSSATIRDNKLHNQDRVVRESIDFTSGKHFVQLAGGTNDYSATAALQNNITDKLGFGGYAFGGFARKQIGQYLNELEAHAPGARLEEYPAYLQKCLNFAQALVLTVRPSLVS